MSVNNTSDEALLQVTRNAVRELVNIRGTASNEVVIKQCQAAAEVIGTMLAPQLYGARIHGVGNAVSNVIRVCAEALFWLEFDDTPSQEAIDAVKALSEMLSTPSNAYK